MMGSTGKCTLWQALEIAVQILNLGIHWLSLSFQHVTRDVAGPLWYVTLILGHARFLMVASLPAS